MQIDEIGVTMTPHQRSMASAGWKAMIPICGQPFLAHLLDQLVAGGIRHVCVVMGPGRHPLQSYLEAYDDDRVQLSSVVQPAPGGTAHALACARSFLETGPTVVVNGDNLYPSAVIEAVRNLHGHGLAGFHAREVLAWSQQPPERIMAYALLRTDPGGRLSGIEEKPSWTAVQAMGPDPMVSMNCWRFTPSILEALGRTRPSVRGEAELPDAVRLLLADGVRVQVVPVRSPVPDLTSSADIARVTAYLSQVEG